MDRLKSCPFCGGEAEIERYGDARKSTIYACTDCGCRLETGEEWDHGKAWNTRTAPPAEAGREEIARIILGPKSSWNRTTFGSEPLSEWSGYPEVSRALAKADAILAACGRK